MSECRLLRKFSVSFLQVVLKKFGCFFFVLLLRPVICPILNEIFECDNICCVLELS